jgi:DNA-binding CsgD family transcriptional regulator/predicted ester cyclase
MDNKALIKEFFNQCLVEKNVDIIDEVISPQILARSFACSDYIGIELMKTSTIEWSKVFPNTGEPSVSLIHSDPQLVIADIWQSAKHEQEVFGMSPTGKPIKIPLSVACVFNDQQKIVDYTIRCNLIQLVKQIQPDNMAQVLTKLKQPIFSWLENTKAQHHNLIKQLRVITQDEEVLKFTPRQLECLSLWLHAKTSKEISQILAISSKSVNFYLDKAKATLRSSSRSQVYERLDELNTIHLFNALHKHLTGWPA